MKEHFDPSKDIHNIVFTTDKCEHCGDPITPDTYVIGIVIRKNQKFMMYCSMKCQVGDTLDQLKLQIEYHQVLDASWAPIVQQLHDQIFMEAENDTGDKAKEA